MTTSTQRPCTFFLKRSVEYSNIIFKAHIGASPLCTLYHECTLSHVSIPSSFEGVFCKVSVWAIGQHIWYGICVDHCQDTRMTRFLLKGLRCFSTRFCNLGSVRYCIEFDISGGLTVWRRERRRPWFLRSVAFLALSLSWCSRNCLCMLRKYAFVQSVINWRS